MIESTLTLRLTYFVRQLENVLRPLGEDSVVQLVRRVGGPGVPTFFLGDHIAGLRDHFQA
jgi:hypothetical protein